MQYPNIEDKGKMKHRRDVADKEWKKNLIEKQKLLQASIKSRKWIRASKRT